MFQIQTTVAGVMVSTAFLTQDGQLDSLPAVFPNLGYALEQINALCQHVIEHFSQATQVGVQVIAANAAASEAVAQNKTEDQQQSVEGYALN